MIDTNHIAYIGAGNINRTHSQSDSQSDAFLTVDPGMSVVRAQQHSSHPINRPFHIKTSYQGGVASYQRLYDVGTVGRIQTINAILTDTLEGKQEGDVVANDTYESIASIAQGARDVTGIRTDYTVQAPQYQVIDESQKRNKGLLDAFNAFIGEVQFLYQHDREKIAKIIDKHIKKDGSLGSVATKMTGDTLRSLIDVPEGNRARELMQPFQASFLDTELFFPQIQSLYTAFAIKAMQSTGSLDQVPGFIIQLQSPTGTGKTEQFIIAQQALFNKDRLDLTFTNSEKNVSQLFERYTQKTKRSVTSVNVVERKGDLFLDMKTRSSQLFTRSVDGAPGQDVLNIFAQQSYQLNISQSKIVYKNTHALINGRSTVAIDFEKSVIISEDPELNDNLAYKEVLQQLGDVIIACAHNVPFLYKCGVIPCEQPIGTVVFDEVDVYYSLEGLREFHQLFFKYNNLASCPVLVMCSATLDKEFIDLQDDMLSAKRVSIQLAHMKQEVPSIYGIPEATFILDHQRTTGMKNNLYIHHSIASTFKRFGFVRLSTIAFDDTAGTDVRFTIQEVVSFMQSVFSKVYIYFPCKNGPGFEYMSHKQLQNDYQEYKYHWLYAKSDPKKSANPLKQLVNNILMHRDYAILSDKKLHFVNTKLRKVATVNMFERFRPFISFQTGLVPFNPGYVDTLVECIMQESKIREGRTLVLHFDDPIATAATRILTEAFRNFRYMSDTSKDVDVKKIRDQLIRQGHDWVQNQPFVQQFEQQLMSQNDQTWEELFGDASLDTDSRNILIENVERAGRGLDIPNLEHVIILIPLYVDLHQYNVSLRQIKQSMGRVARGGKMGICTFLLMGDLRGEVQHWLYRGRDYDFKHYTSNHYDDSVVKRICALIEPNKCLKNFNTIMEYITQLDSGVSTVTYEYLQPNSANMINRKMIPIKEFERSNVFRVYNVQPFASKGPRPTPYQERLIQDLSDVTGELHKKIADCLMEDDNERAIELIRNIKNRAIALLKGRESYLIYMCERQISEAIDITDLAIKCIHLQPTVDKRYVLASMYYVIQLIGMIEIADGERSDYGSLEVLQILKQETDIETIYQDVMEIQQQLKLQGL